MEQVDLIGRIAKEYSKYSKGQKRIARYILDHYDKAAYLTAGALGREVSVSESTVVRFAFSLGYNGYPHLQRHLQEIIKNKLNNVQRLGLMEGLPPEKVIDTALRMEIANLKVTREDLDIGTFMQAVHLIAEAKTVYIIGFRSSAPLAQFFAHYLGFILESPHLISRDVSDVYSQLIHTGPKDVVVGLGFPRYSNQTVKALRFARERGARIVSITDTVVSPLYELSDHCILARSEMNSFVDSLVAPLSIINSLIIMVGLEKKEMLAENFRIMEEAWSADDVYAYEPSIVGDENA